jgi:HEAT repeat protein
LQEAALSAGRTEERSYAIDRLHTLIRNKPEHWGSVIGTLTRVLESEQDEKVRYRAVEVLSQIPDTRIEAPMLRAVGDSSVAISSIAFQVLSKMNGMEPVKPLIEVMKDGMLPEMPKTMRDIDDPRTAAAIVSVIKDQKKIMSPHERMTLFKALGCLKTNGLKALIDLLKDEDDRNKRRAILVLSSSVGAEKKTDVTEGILNFFKDGYGKLLTAEESILALAAARDPRSVTALLEVVKMNGGVLPEEVPLMFRSVDGKELLPALIKALQNEDAFLRVSAAEILGISHEYGAVAPLIGALHDKDENVRASAARALGELADRRAVEPLLAFAENHQEKEEVRIQAVRALPKVNHDRALPVFQKIKKNPAESVALRLAAKYAKDAQTKAGTATVSQK